MTPIHARPAPWQIIERGLQVATGRCVVIVEERSRTDLRFAASTLTTNGVARATSTTVIALDDRPDGCGVGIVSSAVRSMLDIDLLVADASARAQHAPAAADAGALPAGEEDAGFDRPSPSTSPEILASIATDLGRAFRNNDQPTVEWFGYAEHVVTSTWLGTSEGTRRVHHHPVGRLEATGKGPGRGTSVWEGRATKDFTDVSVDEVAAGLRQKLTWSAEHASATIGRQRVILPAGALIDLMIPMIWGASAREAREGRSVFSGPDGGTRIGEVMGRPSLSICSDPHDRRAPTRPFVVAAASGPLSSVFDNGLALESTAWLNQGRLDHLIGPRSEQRHSPAAVNAIDNVLIDDSDGHGSLEDLIARTEDALLLTCLWYIREVDPQTMLSTGLTRDGVYRVRDGQVVGTVGNFRFNDSPVDVLSRIVDASASAVTQPREWADYADANVAPAVVIDGFNLSTHSEAL